MIKNVKYNLENKDVFKLIYLAVISSVGMPLFLGYLSKFTQYRFAEKLGQISGIYIVIGIFIYVACSIVILLNTLRKNKQ